MMKKRILCLWLVLCLCLSGCDLWSRADLPHGNSNTSKTTEPSATTTGDTALDTEIDDMLGEYLETLPLVETPAREYGEETAYIQMSGKMVARILYPEVGVAALDKAIQNWLTETVNYYQGEWESADATDDSAELTAEYDSYVVNDEIVSIKITGFYERPYLAHPIDIIATFHANIETKELLVLEDILLPGGLALLREKVIADAGIEQELADDHILDYWTLKNEGLEIILERGDYLPMSEGTVTLLYPYDEITEIFSLSEEGEESPGKQEPEKNPEAEMPEEPDVLEIDPTKPMIALTFDDGPSKHTARLLDAFATHGGKGTFFVVGNLLDGRGDVIRRIVAERHDIAGHSWNHRQLTKLSAEELKDQLMTTRAKIYELTGVDSTLLRPPYGSYNAMVKQICADLGIAMVNWSVDTLDWKHKDADVIYDTIMNTAKDGDIVLCHDLHGTTVDAMERVIPALIERGYQLVTVSQLLAYKGKQVIAGGVYNKG